MSILTLFKVLKQKNIIIPKSAQVLDFGCGAGNTVQKLCELGYNAYGVDIKFKEGPYAKQLIEQDRLKKINTHDGSIPFDDNCFDFVFSEQVLEHVPNYNLVASEISRISMPNGCSLHKFPSRLRPIESHRYVPFCSVIRSRIWMALWVILGFYKSKHKDKKISTIVSDNLYYLNTKTNYLSSKEIKDIFKKYFSIVEYADFEWLSNSPNKRGRLLARASYLLPFIPWVYRVFWSRVLFLRK